jgi:hypothetical protein
VNPYEPTQRPQAFHDTWTRADFYIPPPPPPPKPPSRWRYLWAVILLAVGFVIVGAFAYNAMLRAAQSIVRTITPTAALATATPTPTVSITAAKVYAVFESHGLAKGGAEDDTAYDAALGKLRPVGGTVDFTDVQTQQPYTISVFATTAAATRASDILFNGGDNLFIANGTCMLHVSLDLTDDSGCTGPCSPRDIGVWVYSDITTAQQAYMEVANDEAHQGEIPMMGKPAEYVHGRCLLLVQVQATFCARWSTS